MPAKDLTGLRFGKLLVLENVQKGSKARWRCLCDCGQYADVLANNLKSRHEGHGSKACGKCRKATPSSFKPKHGAATKRTPTYETWRAMRRRCATRPEYAGITICPEWDDFIVFLADMGERPEGKTIDRIDNSLGYFPGNCRWATPLEQTRNRSNAVLHTEDGRTMPIADWAREYGIKYYAMHSRIRSRGTVRLKKDEDSLVRMAA